MVLGNTLDILRPPGVATRPIQTQWNEDLVKNMHDVLGRMQQQLSATTSVSVAALTSFATKALLEAATVPLVVTSVQLNGYTATGDGGGGLYKRVGSEPSHPLKVQSAEGAWWEIAPDASGINVFQAGAVGSPTDDTAPFKAAADAVADIGGTVLRVPAGTWVLDLDTTDTSILTALDGAHFDGDIDIKLKAGVFNLSTLTLNPQNGHRVNIVGADLVSTTILSSDPSVVATNVSGNRETYAVTIDVADASAFATGDWVVVETSGLDLDYLTNNDETVDGARRRELDGFWEVTATNTSGTDTITVKNLSRQSVTQFPGAGTIAAAEATYTGGTIKKFPTVLKFAAQDGIVVEGPFGNIRNLAIVGDAAGSSKDGVTLDDGSTLGTNQGRSLGMDTVGVANFTGVGVQVSGASTRFSGDKVYSSGHGSHAFRINNTIFKSTNSMASGCGDSVGHGFFALNAANAMVSNSLANGCFNSGFIANRAAIMSAETCHSISHGNWADNNGEGKGFECESASKVLADTSISIFNNQHNFYCLAGSEMACQKCVGSASLRSHGFYTILGATMFSRHSVAQRNTLNGMYAYQGSMLSAQDARADNNTSDDFKAQGSSFVWAKGALGTPTYNVNLDSAGGNQIIGADTFELGTKLILQKGTNLEIASGEITVTHSFHVVDTQDSDPTDTLVTINGGIDGMVLVIRQLSGSRDITFAHAGAGNISLNDQDPLVFTGITDTVTFMFDSASSKWLQLAASNNAGI